MQDEDFGVQVSPSSVLQNLLQQYPSGGQFISEALQNAEDTDRATRFCAVLDLQHHPTEHIRKDYSWRARLQGPAILFYDNGGFEERDWKSLQSFYKSEKKHSPSEVGKYGMGSRSFFHIGDVIQIVSGTKFAELDPDERVSSNGRYGARIDFESELFGGKKFSEAYPDECAPFNFFGCTMDTPFDGTIIRVPLRQKSWASESSFMPEEFGPERAQQVFKEFVKVMRRGDVAMFLPRLRCLEIFVCKEHHEMQRLASIEVEQPEPQEPQRREELGHSLLDVKQFLKQFDTTKHLQDELKKSLSTAPTVHEHIIFKSRSGPEEAQEAQEAHWLRFGRFFDCHALDLPGEVPFVCVAMPLGGAATGLAFAHLPLPIKTGLPVHVHAGFALQDNRRGIWRQAEDTDGIHKTWASWNEYIIKEAICQIYADALKLQLENAKSKSASDMFSHLWPRLELKKEAFQEVLAGLVHILRSEAVLRTAFGDRVKPNDAQLLDLPTDALKTWHDELEKLCLEAGMKIVNPPEHIAQLLRHYEAINIKDCVIAINEALLPRHDVSPQLRLRILLALLHWAGSTFNPEQLEDLRTMLKDLEWIPLADGYGAVSATFDPDAKLPPLHVVTRHLPDLSKWIEEQFTKDQAKYVWQALRSCGMKKEITWEDALEEAEHISHSGDHNLSKILFKHLGQNYSAMHGKKEECMDKLKGLKWVLAHPHQDAASKSPHTSRGTVLRSLSEIFPVSEFDFVWAVESTLHTELDVPVPAFLKASRSVKSEPTVLVSQLEACARAAPGPDDTPTEQPPRTGLVPPEKLSDFTIPMKELYENHKESAARLLKPLRDLAFLPCMPKSEGGAILFQLEHAALESDQGHQKLLPVFGIVHSDVRELAVQIGVEKRPGVSSLVDCIPRFGAEMAVVLCTELAGRLEKYKDDALLYKAVLANLQVPTATGQFLPSREVYVNDAPWTRSGPVETLDERISHVHGRRLGCTSVRNKLAQECEDGSDEEDAFGQEADLVDQVELILKDYSSPSDVVAEFFQNTDDFGASHLVFALSDTTYDGKKVVDQRCEALQGPALYICSSKPLEEEDIKKMQKVGGSAKSHDFQSTGRFGIGMNVMYRYSDCPQLLANGRLHFFDLQKRFVARKKGKRGRKFRIEELQEFFPDSVAPFKDFMHLYPVIFRLPLRTKQSRLGESVNLSSVQSDLQCAQKQAPSMLLFSKSVRRISFSGPSDFTASHEAVMDEAQEQKHKEFFASLPKTLAELDHGEDRQLCVKKRIVSQLGSKDHGREWVVAHTLALSSKSLLNICAALFAEPLGDALLPLAAAAAPLDDKDSQGRICCGLPTPLKTGGRSWINGSFVLSSSRKQILLPENVDSNREKDWNQKLLKGPAASSLKAVMLECRKVVGSEENVEAFFDLLPSGMNTQIEEVLAVATMSSAMKDQLFPVLSANGAGSVKVNWIYGPKPLLRTKRLSQELQNLLASDGLQLVFLPSGAKDVYEKALQHEPRHLDNEELCKFLAETWASLQPNIFKHVALEDVGVQVLSDAKAILQLLNFIAVKADPQFKQLEGVPLFLTHGGKLSAFGRENVCFKSDRELLPNHPDLFVHNEVWQEITGVKGHPEPVGVRKLKTEDLLPFKSEVEALVIEGGRMFGQNAYLRHLWRFISKKENVAQSIKQMQAWQFLPVHSNDGEALVLLNLASQTVDPLAMRLDQKVQQALLCAGLLLLQDGVLDLSGNERLLLEAGIVQKDHDLVSLLLEVDRNTFDTLNLDQRYALLAYFSGLVVREIMHHLPEDISRLPLFKLAQGEGFTDVCEMNVTFCCLDKKDKHAGALEKLMPLKAVLLAWPTMQVRPIYEFLGIQCHSGEDFMVRFILPDLERLCREHTSGTPCTLPKQYFQLLDQLQEFVSEGSSKVIEAAMDKQIFLSASGSPSTASSLVDPNILLIRCFKQCCSEYLPAEGVDQYPELLAGLGLQMFVPEDLLLKLAQQLDAKKDWKVTDELREQSFYLVEAVANTLSRESKDALNATALNAISKLHIVVAAQIEESQAKEEIEAMQGQRGFFHVNACVAKTSLTSLKLRPFRGTAFGESRNLLWSTSFVAYHRHPQVGTAPQLERALKYYTEEMYRNFGAFVTSDHVPFKLLSEHMMNLCSLPHPEKEELTVDKTSTFCEQLMSCFDELRKRNLTTAQHRELRAFNQNGMRCIAVKQDDAANIPEQSQITFASPRRCFTFRNFKAKAFHGYLREAQGLKLYSDMGVADDPDALTLAALTQRVKDEYPDDYSNGRIMRDVDVLQACLKCFHSLVKGSEIERSRLSERLPFNFYYLDEDDKIEDVSALVRIDVECWKDRLDAAGLRFVKNTGDYTMLESLAVFGLQEASRLVEERLANEVDVRDPSPESVQDTLARFLASPIFREGTKDVLLHGHKQLHEEEAGKLADSLSNVTLKAIPRGAETKLCWKETNEVVQGSRKPRMCVLDPSEHDSPRSLFVSDDVFDFPEQGAVELLAALHQLFDFPETVNKALRELFKLAFGPKGPEGIPDVLQKLKIDTKLQIRSSLQPGDIFPEELHSMLVPSVSVVFEAGEYVVAELDGSYVLGQVLRWDPKEESVGLMRQYRVQLSQREPQTISQTDLYKISGNTACPIGGDASQLIRIDLPDEMEAAEKEVNDKEVLEEIKAQLKSISKMEERDCKKALRRLYLTWHPDQAGEMDLANQIFRLLREFEDWYRNGPEGTSPRTSKKRYKKGRENRRKPQADPASRPKSAQASWFNEFETERERREETRRESQKRPHVVHRAVFVHLHTTQKWTEPRIVDEEEAPRWIRQAERDLKVMLKVASPSEGGPFFADSVWYASQVVEKALKSAMLRTCGLTRSEYTGEDCHDIVAFHERLKKANAATAPQRRAQNDLPGSESVMQWLKDAYLAARYPNATPGQIPADAYTENDAQMAMELAHQVFRWAKSLEDLPEPKVEEKRTKVVFMQQGVPAPAASPAQSPKVSRVHETVEMQKKGVPQPPPANPLKPTVAPPPLATTPKVLNMEESEAEDAADAKRFPPGVSMNAMSRRRRMTLGCNIAFAAAALVRAQFPKDPMQPCRVNRVNRIPAPRPMSLHVVARAASLDLQTR